MAKKLKIRIPDKKDDILIETTQKGLGWMRRFQGPLTIGGAVVVCAVVLVVYGLELERKSGGAAWEEYLKAGPGKTAETYAAIVEGNRGSTVEPWALLDQAHALSRTGKAEDQASALKIYQEVVTGFSENEVVQRVAREAMIGMEKEMAFRLPEAPPGEEESAPPGEGESPGAEKPSPDENASDEETPPPAEEKPSDDPPPTPPAREGGTEEKP